MTWIKRCGGIRCKEAPIYVFPADDGSFCTYVISVHGDKASEYDFVTIEEAKSAAIALYEALSE